MSALPSPIMKCPNCGNPDTKVAWTREDDERIKRARDCEECGKRFQTAEALVEVFERARHIGDAYRELRRAVGEE